MSGRRARQARRRQREVEAAPVAEAPVAEAPVAEAPVAEAPVAEAPVAEARQALAGLLDEGVPAADAYRVRLARPGDTQAVARLIRLAEIEPEPELLETIDSGISGSIARLTIGGAATHEDAVTSALFPEGRGPDLRRGLGASSTILVATRDGDDEPIGVCHTTPPGPVMARIGAADGPVGALYAVLLRVRRLSSVSVDPGHRGAGLGRALVELATHLAFELRAEVLYGHVRTDGGLAGWYRDAGFTVLEAGRGLDFSELVSVPAWTRPGPFEQLVVAMAVPGAPIPVLAGAAGQPDTASFQRPR